MYDQKETTSRFMENEDLKNRVFADLTAFLKKKDFTFYDAADFN